jgi:AraC family L-rhamnose operon transcriptional activator RhaR
MPAASYDNAHFTALQQVGGLPVFTNRVRHAGPARLHDHDFLEIAVVTAGAAVHGGIHGERAVGRGDCLVLHPGQWHGYAGGDCWLRNLCLPGRVFAHELAWLAADPQVAALVPPVTPPVAPSQEVLHLHLGEDDLAEVEAALERIRRLQTAPDAIRVRSEAIAQAAVALARIAAAAPRRHLATGKDAAVAGLAALLEADLARPWTLAELGRRAGLTREHLCRRFRRVHGVPPLAWLNRRRAERAAVLLLSTDAVVAEVGRQVGWADPNYCARRFRAVFGVNPAAYRSQVAAAPGG